MGYPDPGQRFRGDSGLRSDSGYPGEPEYRSEVLGGPGAFSPGSYPVDDAPGTDTTASLDRRPLTAAELDDVFDDPNHGDPGMDRMLVHVLWEVLLLLGVGALAAATWHWHHGLFSGDRLRTLLLSAAGLGVVTMGVALSLRAGAVNLAVGPIAVAAGLYEASHGGGLVPDLAVPVLLAAGLAGLIGLVVVVVQVPGWAASLGGGLLAVMWIFKHTQTVAVTGGYLPQRHALYWYLGFVALSLLGGLLGLVKTIRRGLGRYRPVADPALRRGLAAAVLTVLALAVSGALAGLGGALAALANSAAVPGDGLTLTGLALGTALFGGTSAFGRRGGIAGTALAATLVALFLAYGEAQNWRMSPFVVAAGLIGAGLLVTRLVESLGRPRAVAAGDRAQVWNEARGTDPSPARSGGAGSGGWSSQLPARSLDDTWGSGASDDRWGA